MHVRRASSVNFPGSPGDTLSVMANRATVTCSIDHLLTGSTLTTVSWGNGRTWSKSYDSALDAWIEAYYVRLAEPLLGAVVPGRSFTVQFKLHPVPIVIDSDVLREVGFEED